MKRVLSFSGVGVGHVARRQQKIQVLRVAQILRLRFTPRVARALRVGGAHCFLQAQGITLYGAVVVFMYS